MERSERGYNFAHTPEDWMQCIKKMSENIGEFAAKEQFNAQMILELLIGQVVTISISISDCNGRDRKADFEKVKNSLDNCFVMYNKSWGNVADVLLDEMNELKNK